MYVLVIVAPRCPLLAVACCSLSPEALTSHYLACSHSSSLASPVACRLPHSPSPPPAGPSRLSRALARPSAPPTTDPLDHTAGSWLLAVFHWSTAFIRPFPRASTFDDGSAHLPWLASIFDDKKAQRHDGRSYVSRNHNQYDRIV